MDLKFSLKAVGLTLSEIGRRIGVPAYDMSRYASGAVSMPADVARAIEAETHGAITVSQLAELMSRRRHRAPQHVAPKALGVRS
jgi:DNA-binding transcriptional regulator YdaS (Cro superfamily)